MPSHGVAGATAMGFAMAFGAAQAADSPAFPGAVGFGMNATGWRGGGIVRVTSLDDAGPGTLRACAQELLQPRICVFDVSGTITLDAPIFVQSNAYIAGQTAPGGGVQLRLGLSNSTPLIIKNASDVVVRHLKVRPGPSPEPRPTVDGITLENAQRVYLDHLSVMFATDENLNIHVSNSVAADITIANSIFALGLDRANHPKGRHSKGALICSDEGPENECGRITLWQNLFAHNRDRNPDIKATSIGPVEVINNVFYNPISQFGEFYNLIGDTRIAYLGNIALPGPSTNFRTPEAVQAFAWDEEFKLEIFESDNRLVRRRWCIGARDLPVMDAEAERHRVDNASWVSGAPVLASDATLDHVLANAGDILPNGRDRDALDASVVQQVRDCSGSVIDAVGEVGGWPEIATASPKPDGDGDGLPDDWELGRSALDPSSANDVWAIDPETQLPFIEAYLSELAGDVPQGR